MGLATQGETLLKLVDADRLLLQLTNQLEALPQRQKLEELQRTYEQLAEKVEQVAMLKLRQEMSIRALRDENQMLQEKVSANQAQIEENSSKYKEVVLLAAEIESLNKRAEKIAFDISGLNESIGKIKAVEDQLTGRILAVDTRRIELTTELDENTGRIEEQLLKLNNQRSKLVSMLPKDLVERYDRQRELKQGIGAALLDGRICTGCHIELTEGQLAKAKSEVNDAGVGVCPSCHRLLVM